MRFRSAFVPHDIDRPIAGASYGPAAGLTVAIKDMYDIAGERTGGGNPDWLSAQAPAAVNASAVQKLLDGGASIIGKTVCDEFFYSVAGVNAHYGTPVNPRAPGRIPGGSSSGSASAAAAGACDVALGSDTGGSVRVPAAFCGLYGIRPTHGRVDLAGAMLMAPSFDVCGWLTTVPGVFRRVGAVLLGSGAVPATISTVTVLEDAFAQADADVAALCRGFLQTAGTSLPEQRAVAIAPAGFDGVGLDAWRETFRIIQSREIWQTYGDFVTRRRPRLGPGIKERMEMAATVTEAEATAASAARADACAHIRALARPGAVLALPTAPCIAPPATLSGAEMESFRVRAMRLTCIAGIAGLPQVSIPIGNVAGCPVGLSFIGWAGGDEALLDLAVGLARWVGGTSDG